MEILDEETNQIDLDNVRLIETVEASYTYIDLLEDNSANIDLNALLMDKI